MKILLLQLRRLGDIVLTTSAINALRAQNAEVSLAVAAGSELLLPSLTGLARAITPGALAWREVRRQRFDIVIDLTKNDRSAVLTALSGARRRIVSQRLQKQSRTRAFFYNEFVDCAMKQMHTADYYLALLRPLGVNSDNAAPVLALPEGDAAAAANTIERRFEGKPFVIFHVGSARTEKFWEPERWANVISSLPEEYLAVLSSGPDEKEKLHAAEIRSQLRRPVVDLSGQLQLLVLAGLVQRARLLLSVDSVPMHFGAAFATPQIALFGPTNPFHWRPRHSAVNILFGPDPRPQREFTAQAPKFAMRDISTPAVIDAMRCELSAAPTG